MPLKKENGSEGGFYIKARLFKWVFSSDVKPVLLTRTSV